MGLTTRHFRQQHRQLLAFADRLAGIVDQRELESHPDEARAAVEALAAHLRHHLEAEDHGLYAEMLKSNHPLVRSAAERFASEMGGLSSAFADYVKSWPAQAIRADSRAFGAATRAVLGALRSRIAREDEQLYPLADGLTVSAARPGRARAAGQPPLVHVVDDNDGDFMLLREAWRDIGVACSFEHFGHAEKLLDRAADLRVPDLVVVDFNLPIIGGQELVKRLRARPAYLGVPIVMCSSGSAAGESELAFACGATGFYPKPATFSEYLPFVDAMNDLIAYYREP